jgi:hypothetical protein
MRRTVLAGVLGGVAAFLWSSISHMVLPLGEAGVRSLPNERPVLETLRREVPESGLYLYPGIDPAASPEAQEEWNERYRTGPNGILVFHPVGGEFGFPRRLLVEFLTNVLGGVLAASVLARGPLSLGRGALLGSALGFFAWSAISLSYWNWYDFPDSFVLAEGADQAIGWLVAGAVIAKVAGDRR